MKKLVVAFMVLLSAGAASAQEEGSRGMEVIDSPISAWHHYDPRVVKVDTQYTLQRKKGFGALFHRYHLTGPGAGSGAGVSLPGAFYD